MEVWSFSPPEDVLFEAAATTPAQRNLLNVGGPPRPLSAVEYRSTGTQDQPMTGMSGLSVDDNIPPRAASTRLGQIEYTTERISNLEDVEMLDHQPSTAPLPGTGPTFFHDD